MRQGIERYLMKLINAVPFTLAKMTLNEFLDDVKRQFDEGQDLVWNHAVVQTLEEALEYLRKAEADSPEKDLIRNLID